MNAGLVSPDHVLLDLAATTREEAVRAVAELLRADGQIASWDQFWASVGPRQIVDIKGGGCEGESFSASLRCRSASL